MQVTCPHCGQCFSTSLPNAGGPVPQTTPAPKPDAAEEAFNQANVLLRSGRFDQAIAAYRVALQLRPTFASAWNNLGTALKDSGRAAEAIGCYERAAGLKPDSHVYFYNAGAAFAQMQRYENAVAAYRRAIVLKPDFALSHSSLSGVLRDLGRIDESIDSAERALAFDPNLQSAHYNLGNALKDAGAIEQAVACYQRALELAPNDCLCHGNLAYVVHFHPGYDGAAILSENRRFDQAHARSIVPFRGPWTNSRERGRRLRIGYAGADFRDHCQSLFMIPLLANHDRTHFEIYAYADVAQPDELTRRTQSYVDQWRLTSGLADAAVAELIRRDQIDILVDLTMHMARARPLVFARKPAPVQVAWLAYPGTTGLSAMDWRLTDPYLDPPGENDANYSERSYRLTDSFWCYDPLVAEAPVTSLPALENGRLTFGCLNNFCKVSPPSVQLWSRVLSSVAESRLLLLALPGRHRDKLRERFAGLQIDPDRIEFVDLKPRPQYLRHFDQIDICLDTIPYNGHTTSLDSYWMGVPVVTLVGKTAVGRGGWSQLNNLGLTELAAHSEQSFVRVATELAHDLPRLQQYRGSLRERLRQSPLMDAPRFARSIEAAFRDMWKSWTEASA